MMFFPLLSRIGYGLSWQSALVIIWGGLRGAVGLSLALIIYQDPLLGAGVTRNVTIIGPDGNDVVVHKVVGEKVCDIWSAARLYEPLCHLFSRDCPTLINSLIDPSRLLKCSFLR